MTCKLYKFFFRLAPDFFYARIFDLLVQQKPLQLTFLDDKYIYKNIDKGYDLLYCEESTQENEYKFFNLHNNRLNQLNILTLKKNHSFNWLQNLKVINTQTSNSKIFDLIDNWIDKYGYDKNKIVFEVDILAERIFNLLTSPNIRNIKNKEFNVKLIKNLSFQIRLFLILTNINNHKNAILINKTLFVIGKSIGSFYYINSAVKNIYLYLKKNVVADGGILWSSPSEVLEVLEHVLYVYKNLNDIQNIYKKELRNFIDKLIIFIKSVRYKDGGLGVFNGGYEEDNDKINFLLSLGNINANRFVNLTYSGYFWVSSKQNIDIMVKTNSFIVENIKNSKTINNNSILSQEILIYGKRIFVNNSSSIVIDEQKLTRDYYSTLLFYDKNNNLINMPYEFQNTAYTPSNNSNQDWYQVKFTYRGLENSYGAVWHKTLCLAKKDNCLLGEDLITLKNNSLVSKVVLKFILHPSVVIKNHNTDNKNIILEINNKLWVFKSKNLIFIENELYKGKKDELFPTLSLNMDIDMKDRFIEWALFSKEFLNIDINKI